MQKNKSPLISIIIVNYNGLRFLDKLFESIEAQTYKNIEVIVIDSNSTDGSKSVLQAKTNIKLIETENNGYATACNKGISQSNGEFILILNNDTWLDFDFVEQLYNELVNRNLDVIAPREKTYEGENLPFYVNKIDPLGHPIFLFGDKYKNEKPFYLSGVSLLFSKKLYEETGGMDSDFFLYFEETDWFWRLNLLNKTYSYSENVHIYHAGASSTTHQLKPNSFIWRNQNELQMVLKNYSLLILFFIIPIYVLQNIVEMLFFLLLLKPMISKSYCVGLYYNLKNLPRTAKKRKRIQEKRKINDFQILKRMYIGVAKIHHLRIYLVNIIIQRSFLTKKC